MRFLLCRLIVTLLLLALPLNIARAEDPSLTLQETMNWIKLKLENEFTVADDHGQEHQISHDDFVSDGCGYSYQTAFDGSSAETSRASLRGLQAEKVIIGSDPNFKLNQQVVHLMASTNDGQPRSLIKYVKKPLADRLARAMKYAVELCRGKSPNVRFPALSTIKDKVLGYAVQYRIALNNEFESYKILDFRYQGCSYEMSVEVTNPRGAYKDNIGGNFPEYSPDYDLKHLGYQQIKVISDQTFGPTVPPPNITMGNT